MIVENKYTSVGVNRTPTALDWGFNGLLCYAAANSVAIQDPSLNLTRTFAAHSERVNTVKWIQRKQFEREFEFISGADDHQCIYWNIKSLENIKKIFLKGHNGGITSVDAIFVDNQLTIATTSTDSTIRLWRFAPDLDGGENVESFQVFNLCNGICFSVKMCLLPEAGLLLAYATDDDNIHFYGENYAQCFERVEMLTGHEDWVRGLDFAIDINGDLLLASSSQDSFIRIWRISPKSSQSKDFSGEDNLIQVEERTFKVAEKTFVLSLDSVLQGHENWVYSVDWSKNSTDDSLQLLSSSMDKTMIIWSIDIEQELWTEKIRVGDVGGNSLGFYGAKFHANGKSIIGHGFLGSLHLWKENDVNSKLWEPGVINGGHFKEVRDIGWEPTGQFLFSASTDQTTRIHACWKRDKTPITFHEIARPQVHGYDMQCLAVISRYSFASAAEEKIIRTFQAPGNFVENFRTLVCSDENDQEGDQIIKSHQKGASVPSLGLSNKAVYEEDLINPKIDEKKFKDEYPENYFVPITMTQPPTEEYLTQNTLWPELQKLYAHGYELYSLVATSNGKILASACKATTIEHSEIILWNTQTWKVVQRLRSHKLTVTQMKFSSDGSRLLSVGRDRRWTMFENKSTKESEEINFEVVASSDRQNGVHERIIWCCGFTHDDMFFATGSRDGKVVVWSRSTVTNESSLKEYEHLTTLQLPQESVTALTFAKGKIVNNGGYLLAIGLESGIIQLYSLIGTSFALLKSLNQSEAHHLCVNKLEFRPNFEKFQLASCGNDHLVKVYEITI